MYPQQKRFAFHRGCQTLATAPLCPRYLH
jgi:hypothetical protein